MRYACCESPFPKWRRENIKLPISDSVAHKLGEVVYFAMREKVALMQTFDTKLNIEIDSIC